MDKKMKTRYCASYPLFDFKNKERNRDLHTEYMLNRTQSMFKYNGLPNTIPQWALERLLQINGFACITKVNNELYAFYGGLGGELDAYYMPTICTVANPYLKFDKNLEIDKDCVIVRNDVYYSGLTPLFNRYSSLMAETELSMKMATVNSRVQYLLSASDDNTKKEADLFITGLDKGELSSVHDSKFFDSIKSTPYGDSSSNSTIKNLIELEQYLKGSWFNDIGLQSNFNMKREQLNDTEVGINEKALIPLIDTMLECRKNDIEKVNTMFGTSITVELNSVWEVEKAQSEEELEQAENQNEESENLEESEEKSNDETKQNDSE